MGKGAAAKGAMSLVSGLSGGGGGKKGGGGGTPSGGIVDPHNQIVALENRYSQLGIPNSTMLTQDIGGAQNAAQQASFSNQVQLAQLAQNQQALDQQGAAAAGTAAGGSPTSSSGSGTFDIPSSGTLTG